MTLSELLKDKTLPIKVRKVAISLLRGVRGEVKRH